MAEERRFAIFCWMIRLWLPGKQSVQSESWSSPEVCPNSLELVPPAPARGGVRIQSSHWFAPTTRENETFGKERRPSSRVETERDTKLDKSETRKFAALVVVLDSGTTTIASTSTSSGTCGPAGNQADTTGTVSGTTGRSSSKRQRLVTAVPHQVGQLEPGRRGPSELSPSQLIARGSTSSTRCTCDFIGTNLSTDWQVCAYPVPRTEQRCSPVCSLGQRLSTRVHNFKAFSPTVIVFRRDTRSGVTERRSSHDSSPGKEAQITIRVLEKQFPRASG
eukprot:3741027-Rhodomonas_salina.1